MKAIALLIAAPAAGAVGASAGSNLQGDAWGTLSIVLLIALATLLSEDLTCIATGLLIGRGELSPVTGVFACVAGIYAGDLGLWAIGRAAGSAAARWNWLKSRLPESGASRFAVWFDQYAPQAILTSRFVPGTRVPLYVAAGALGRSPRAFIVWTLVAASLWTPLLVLSVAWVGDELVTPLQKITDGIWPWIIFTVFVVCALRLLPACVTPLHRAKLAAKFSRLWRREFWPSWLFYLPLVPWIAWLSVRHRGFTTITAANPGMPHGGFVGESKSEILRRVPATYVAPFVLVEPADVSERVAVVEGFMRERGLAFPIILKPDAGQRGVGVRLARSYADVNDYLRNNPNAILAQAFHAGPFEAGIFYYRRPGDSRGRIYSITDKEFPELVGDGECTVEQLIWRHPRFRMQAATFISRHATHLSRILPTGERFRLAIAGNHCQGTMFRDGSHLITPELESAIDQIARGYDGFYFGRFDVRYADTEAFKAGRDFTIIELNGATSESTNLYDPAHSLFRAYRILFGQWSLLFQVASRNRALGHAPSGFFELWREIRAHYRDRRVCLVAD